MGLMDRIFKRKDDGMVYICYHRDDSAIAERVCGALEDENISCWLKGRDGADEYLFNETISTIKQSKLFLLILSQNSIDSGFVNAEVDVAFSNEIPLCILNVDGVELSGGLEFFLTNSPSIEASSDCDDFALLIGRVSELLGRDKKDIPLRKTGSSGKSYPSLYDVHISYSTRNVEVADKICAKLEENDLKCWIAPRNITIGTNFAEEIAEAIKSSRIFLVVFSRDYQKSKYAMNELELAFTHDKLIVVVNADGSLPDGKAHFYLKNTQWLDVRGDLDAGLDKLVRDIPSLIGESKKSIDSTVAPTGIGSTMPEGTSQSHLHPTRLHVDLANVENNRFDISGSIRDSEGNVLSYKTIKIYIDGTFRYEVKSQSDGRYSCPVTFNKSGKRTLMACFDGDMAYSPSDDILNVEISKLASEITFSSSSKMAKLGDAILLYGNLKAGDNPITRAPIDIFSGDELIDTVFTSASGNYSIIVPGDEARELDFKAEFAEDDMYRGCEASLSLQVIDSGDNDRPFWISHENPYIFISYKHDDDSRVIPIIRRLHEAGYNIWFDAALPVGEDFDDLLFSRIRDSSLFVIFLSERVIEKAENRNEYMKKELGIAVNMDKDMFPIYLDRVELIAKYMVHLQGLHSKFLPDYDDEDGFIRDCVAYFTQQFNLEPRPES